MLNNHLNCKMITDHKELEARFFQCTSLDDALEIVRSCGIENGMISIHNPQGEYTAVSESSTAFAGRKPKELISNSAYDYFHPEDFQTILKSHAKITIRPDVDKVEYRLRMPNGDFKEVCSLSRQVREQNGLEFLLALTFERR